MLVGIRTPIGRRSSRYGVLFACRFTRKPEPRKQTWIIDEAAELTGFEHVARMFTYGAGIAFSSSSAFSRLASDTCMPPNFAFQA